MKLKSTLWALAFACAAVSCSDDLDDGPNNNGNNENLETAKVNVLINTGTVTKSLTKAAPGENGDDNEVGSAEEYKVNDVTLILFKKNDNADESAMLTDLNSAYELVAAGWTDKIGGMSPGDGTTGDQNFPNSRMTTVEIQVKSGESLLGTTGQNNEYGVLAVTNLGETTGKELVGKVGVTGTGYETVGALADALYADKSDTNGFVMSTHAMTGKVGSATVYSTVSFGTDPSVIPSTTVFVERLSAKIRIAPNGEGANASFTYKVGTEGNDDDKDEVVLESVAIVNQLTSKSYLLKRVSVELGTAETDLDLTGNGSTDILIGDEKASTANPIVGTNFVIDPWTRSKTKSNLPNLPSTPVQLSYINQWTGSTFGELWTTYSTTNNKTVDLDIDALDENGKLHLCYTQENTTSIAGSLKGYNTGALFKATYYPKTWIALNETKNGVDGNATVDYGTGEKTGKTFYTYLEKKFESKEAILAYVIGKAGVTDVNYGTFSDASNAKFRENILKLKGVSDPFGYIEAMVTEAKKETGSTFQTPENFLNAFNPTGDDLKAFNKNVQTYTNGVCYYEYWIHHADNGNPTVTTPMDIAIVRNNIYDMKVTQINNLGSSEVDPTDPLDPSEDGGLKIQVMLYVKNWVVRSNSDIHF